MQVRILGPIEIAGPHGRYQVPGLRRKAVLAALALEPGRAVSRERLAALVWGEDTPATVRNTLQAHISYLRRVLGDRAAVRAVPPGYLLRLGSAAADGGPRDATDAQAAERSLRAALAEGDPARRADRAQEALALWRGPALADVTELAAFHGPAQRLEDLRIRARRLLVDSRLALGLVEQAVEDAEALRRDHPLDEQAGGLLMLALYRAGRQADALAVCREIRCGLREEAGLDPGEALHKLEAAILRQDPDLLRRPFPAPQGSGPPESVTLRRAAGADSLTQVRTSVPAQLPGSVDVVGRAAEIRTLDALLEQVGQAHRPGPAVIAAITGTAGIGKTALALHWAGRVASRFPDGQLYVNLRGFGLAETRVDPDDTLRSFLAALGVPAGRIPPDPAARAAMFRGALAGKRLLILLDNARDVEQVRPLLPGAPGCLVVITSRDQLTPLVACEGAAPVPLDVLAPAAARDLLVRRLGRSRVAAEPAPVRAVIDNCAGLPLALSLAAAWAATHPQLPIAAFAVDIGSLATTFSALDGGDSHTDLRAVFSWSYRTLSQDAARLYRLQSCRPGPGFTVPGAASLAALPRRRTAELVAELTRASLLTEYSPGRFGAHDLLCRFAYQESITHDPAHFRSEGVRRLLEYYLHTADAAACLVDPARPAIALPDPRPGVDPERFGSRAAAAHWFRAEHEELIATVEEAVIDGLDAHAWPLAAALTPVFQADQRWADLAAVCEFGLPAARRCADPVGVGLLTRASALAADRLEHGTSGFSAASALGQRVGRP